jgi:hypothetical protein
MKKTKVTKVMRIGRHAYGEQAETAYKVHTEYQWYGWVVGFGGDYRRATKEEIRDIEDIRNVQPGTADEELANGMIGTLIEL